jgi:hypothetical protein
MVKAVPNSKVEKSSKSLLASLAEERELGLLQVVQLEN